MKVTSFDCQTYIVLASDFMSTKECLGFIQWGETCGFEECKLKATRDTAHRQQGRIAHFDETGRIADVIFSRVRPLVPDTVDGKKPIGCSRNIRMYRYRTGDSFGKHIDESYTEAMACNTTAAGVCQGVSKFTLLVYLTGEQTASDGDICACVEDTCSNDSFNHINDNCTPAVCGGQTNFYKSHSSVWPFIAIPPRAGHVLLHGHGKRCLTHEGSVVSAGTKYVLRTDVLYA